jgi:hypothetical protein
MKSRLNPLFAILLMAAASIIGGCNTQKVSVDATALMLPDPDIVISRPDFASEVAIKRIAYKLELDEEQLEKLRAIKSEIIAIRQEDRSEQDLLINAWITEWRKPRMDEENVSALINEREKLMDLYAPRIMQKVIEFHASLTDNQREMVAMRVERLRDWQPSK